MLGVLASGPIPIRASYREEEERAIDQSVEFREEI
jgi:hypothetical protein